MALPCRFARAFLISAIVDRGQSSAPFRERNSARLQRSTSCPDSSLMSAGLVEFSPGEPFWIERERTGQAGRPAAKVHLRLRFDPAKHDETRLRNTVQARGFDLCGPWRIGAAYPGRRTRPFARTACGRLNPAGGGGQNGAAARRGQAKAAEKAAQSVLDQA
jgi:hypothetical protein